ncbi:MAG: TIGR02678 family protein [Exiguobacterium sp.]|nr:TIGR02678 family protein [Exiguobacterium sp.]MBR2758469.1 TIGR02678 family protein [Exiguobacterium sp.]MBR3061205.1 TIGR02678 family protein [Exiguobacterium sp.]MBR3215288.1 TIGR02678 family protein [Exiguobacterium sp.]
MSEEGKVDERMQDALGILFEQFWVLRTEQPIVYQKIREREHQLKRYVTEKFGFDLIVHQHFIKLEKLPVDPKPWMGIQVFTEPMDYAIFCCALAFTESKSVDEQFLLSHITEDIQEMYPGDLPLDWTNYRHRRSLVRALKQLDELKLIRAVDGDVDLFATNETEEVLYEVSVHARYFMRSYPEDLFNYETMEDILTSEWSRQKEDERRKRVYRKLMFSPIVYRESKDDPDFAYIRNLRNRLTDEFEKYTPFRLEVFKNAAMLVLPEQKQRYTLFPNQKGVTSVALHVADHIRKRNLPVNEMGEIRITMLEFERIVEAVQLEWGSGWAKQYREDSPKKITNELVSLLLEWEFGYVETDSGILVIQSGFGRTTGYYPERFVKEMMDK